MKIADGLAVCSSEGWPVNFCGLLGSIGICINLNEQTIFVIDQEIIQIPKFLIKNGIKNILFRHMHSIKTNLAFFSMTAREI